MRNRNAINSDIKKEASELREKIEKLFIQRRVWSWLRMNASDRPNTCKSRGNRELAPLTTGARVSNAYATFPQDRDSPPKGGLTPDVVILRHLKITKCKACGWACVTLASWRGNGPPRRRCLGVLRGRSPTLVLRHGPDSYGRQQWGILVNGREPEPAMSRAGLRPYGF